MDEAVGARAREFGCWVPAPDRVLGAARTILDGLDLRDPDTEAVPA